MLTWQNLKLLESVAESKSQSRSEFAAMAVGWKPLLPIIMLSALLLYEEWVSTPSCKRVPPERTGPPDPTQDHPDDLKVMMVANLLLLGSEAGFFSLLFRDYYMSKFFTVIPKFPIYPSLLRPLIFATEIL